MLFHWIGATLLGALVPAVILSALLQTVTALPVALVISFGHAVILGLPIALLYRAKRWQWPSLAVVTGFLIGAIPFCILIGVLSSGHGINWLNFIGFLGMIGGLGAAGALAFWLTLHWSGALDDTLVAAQWERLFGRQPPP
jgi:hypothetical protein